MDFYGFSNGVQQANAMNLGSALANNAYDAYNMGAENAWREKNVKKDQLVINADNQDVKKVSSEILSDEVEKGGGTAVGIAGVGMLGKSIRDAGNQLGKAKRIAEAQLKLSTASGDIAEMDKAQQLLDVTNKGDLKGFVKLTAKFATQKAVTSALGQNINKAVNLASDINKGSSFTPAVLASVSTSEGRKAADIITSKAAQIADGVKPEVISSVAGGLISANVTPTSIDKSKAASRARIAAKRAARKLQQPAQEQTGGATGEEDDLLTEQGTAARPDTFKQVNVTEETFGDQYIDPRDELKGFESDLTNVDAFEAPAKNLGDTISRQIIEGFGTDLMAQQRGTAIGTESSGLRGIASNIKSFFPTRFNKGELDLSKVAGALDDVDDQGNTVRSVQQLTAGWEDKIATKTAEAQQGVLERGLGGRDFSGGEPEPEIQEKPVASEEPPSAPERQADTVEQLSEPTVERAVASTGSVSSAGAAKAATLLGTAEHEEAISSGAVDEEGIKAVKALGGFSGAVGGAALKTVSVAGQAVKALGPITNVAFTVDQTYEEAKSLFGKSHSLEGVGGWSKTGDVFKEVGDIAATVGSGLALAGPATFGISDVAALGVELGGGALALAGDLMDDYGKSKQDKAAKLKAAQSQASAVAKQKADAVASNKSVEIATASGNRNLSGTGSIAQVSNSAIRAY